MANRSGGAARGVVAALLVVVVAAVCIRLGLWQLDRLEARRSANARIASAMAQPPLSLDSVGISELRLRPDDFLFRLATARGAFDPEHDIILRGRSHQGRPGVHLVTLLQLDDADGSAIFVNRGWLPAPDAASADPRPHRVDGPVRLTGILQMIPTLEEPEAVVPIEVGDTVVDSWRRLDYIPLVRSVDGATQIPRLYLQVLPSDADAGLPVAVPAPELDEGPHLGYAIQWFGFAAVAVIGFLAVALRGRFQRRSVRPDR